MPREDFIVRVKTTWREKYMRWLTPRLIRIIVAIAVIAGLACGGYYVYGKVNAARVPTKTLAIMPFVAGSADDDAKKRNTGDTITAGMTTTLCDAIQTYKDRNPNPPFVLRVTPYTAVSNFRDSDPLHNGKGMKVQLVLAGRIFTEGKNTIFYMELINVEDGSRIWGKRYTSDVDWKDMSPDWVDKGMPKTIADDVWTFLQKYLTPPS